MQCPSITHCGWAMVQCQQDEHHRGAHSAAGWSAELGGPVETIWYLSPLDRLRGIGVLESMLRRQLGAAVEPAELVVLSSELWWRRRWPRRLR